MAVYTKISDTALQAFLAEYDLGRTLGFRGIAEGVENSNYRLETTTGEFILTLYEKRVEPADLPWFLGLMEHLAERGVPCPRPVAGRDGATLRRLAGRPAAITTFLRGAWPRVIELRHCAPVGAALARMHLAGADFAPRRPNALGPDSWQPLLAACGAGAEALEPGLGRELEASLARITAAWPRQLPMGHIHADLFQDNVFFAGEQVSGLIDFYFAATDLYAYDLAICLNAWCFERDFTANSAKAEALLGAYDRLRPLSPAERTVLPVLCQGAAMRFLLTRLYDWTHTPAGALVTRKDPMEYVRRLRFYLAASDAHAYGL